MERVLERARRMALPAVLLLSQLAPSPLSLASPPARAATTYAYDALGRVVSVRYDDGRQVSWSYDAAGNRTRRTVSLVTSGRAPVTVADVVSLPENLPAITFDPRLNDSDPDGGPLAIQSVSNGASGTASVTGGATSLTYTSTRSASGRDTLVYVVRDVQGLETGGLVTVNLINLPPVAVADTISVLRNTGIVFDPRANDTDPGRDALQVRACTTPVNGIAVVRDAANVNYIPRAGYAGADSFSCTIADADGATAVGAVAVTVR